MSSAGAGGPCVGYLAQDRRSGIELEGALVNECAIAGVGASGLGLVRRGE
ncbi:MAG: hypothetical protein ACI9BK_003095 [Acidimicrobiales bacterium]|jgi:hypothetical protein